MTVSSHFSGVGTVEVAVGVVHANLPQFVAGSASWTTAFVVDKARSCVDILKARLQNTHACIFNDVTHCISDVREVRAGNLIVEDVWKSLAGQRLCLQQCLKHGHLCNAWGANADISGSPCQPFSRAGRRLRRNDPRVLAVLVWAHKMRDGTASQSFILILSVSQHPVQWALHENVQDFDVGLLEARSATVRLFKQWFIMCWINQWVSAGSPPLRLCTELLSDLYSIHSLRVSPSDVGFTMIARPRLYVLLLRKEQVHLAVDLQETYDRVKAYFNARVDRPNAAAALIASAEECLAAENDLRRRRGFEPASMSACDWTYLFPTWNQSLHFSLLVTVIAER
ncbi:unnamed protein product [Symbiodinium sp. CCMP2592]|nr:unnamed protein product [Symbiodinium sp. CCMP2592]